MTNTVEKVVISDGFWQTVPGATPQLPPTGIMHRKGDRVSVTSDELKALEAQGVLGETLADAETPQADAADAGIRPTGGNEVTDEELAALNAESTVAWLNNHPDQVDRLDEIESSRSAPRKTVAEAIESVRALQDEVGAGGA